ncbi:MAG: helix-turn-helix domain-containing protein, partial [Tepidisphaeraceae bacterium]
TSTTSGKVWGGGKAGRRARLSAEKEEAVHQLRKEGKSIAEIARVVGLSRPTIYKAVKALAL